MAHLPRGVGGPDDPDAHTMEASLVLLLALQESCRVKPGLALRAARLGDGLGGGEEEEEGQAGGQGGGRHGSLHARESVW